MGNPYQSSKRSVCSSSRIGVTALTYMSYLIYDDLCINVNVSLAGNVLCYIVFFLLVDV